ncbi:MAG: YebC/PmpR family DNA-binding transcriptional regulator [Candidatus Eisenbacteria bacterium]|uniref:Probable transcriptional regulatory protein E6K80_06680 n=1 Tax=Eiseniibacteriota bacterium TaxID=2212470 RepID=A0A538U5A2_UNCEI|nr:MAG: YebC/PmpR family DNA-binding transcriptional regulator [Candidatus Eisenbacteria bacterium]
MSGHSKWATIKRKKAATDQARGKVFSKYIKEITIAARHGGGDPDANPRLRTAINAAKSVNMPASNIDRAIKRGTGEVGGVHYEETQYEGYGPGGAAILVEVATDNRNRTTGDVRHTFTKYGGKLGEAGSVAHLFKPCGLVVVDAAGVSEDALIEAALEAGADDVTREGDTFEITTPTGRMEPVREAIAARGIPIASAELTRIASLHVPVEGREAETLLKLVDALEDHEDVQKVYSNFDVAEDVIARLSK